MDKTGLIRIDGAPYRVPHDLANKDVQIQLDGQKITVSFAGRQMFELDKAKSVYIPKPQLIEEPFKSINV